MSWEARDFIRAIMLHLLDGLETYPGFIDFMYSEKIIDENGFTKLMDISRTRQYPSKKNSEQESVEVWFESLSHGVKQRIERILNSKPELTKEGVRRLIEATKDWLSCQWPAVSN
jgi:hypothetical protein